MTSEPNLRTTKQTQVIERRIPMTHSETHGPTLAERYLQGLNDHTIRPPPGAPSSSPG